MGQWGTISYTDNEGFKSFDLKVTSIAQPLTLDGSSAQTRTKKQFYPRSYVPGDIAVEGICDSQDHYQQLALFIREHQLSILNANRSERFNTPTSTAGYQHLLLLDIPTEQLQNRGFIKKFGMDKKGLLEPAPKFTFNFTVVFEPNARNFALSSRVRRYYAKGAHT